MFGMQELNMSGFLKVLNSLFSNTVLEVSIDATKGNGLLAVFDTIEKQVIGEAAIISMVVLNADAQRLGAGLKGFLGLKGLCRCDHLLEMHMGEVQAVVNEDHDAVASFVRQ